jgi:hypothetical protein
MPSPASLAPLMADMAWLGAGLLLGVALLAAWQRFGAWREARAAEWDPY